MELSELQRRVNDFVRAMGWYDEGSSHPQRPRNLAISLVLEASEVLEHFQWHEDEVDREEIGSELADVMNYVLQLAHLLDVDLERAVLEKLEKNRGRNW